MSVESKAQLHLEATTMLSPDACLDLIKKATAVTTPGANYAGSKMTIRITAQTNQTVELAISGRKNLLSDDQKTYCLFGAKVGRSQELTTVRVGGLDDWITITQYVLGFIPAHKEIAAYGYYKRFLKAVEAALLAGDSAAHAVITDGSVPRSGRPRTCHVRRQRPAPVPTDGQSFCTQCGSALDRGSRSCGSCGTLVNRDRGKRMLWLGAASLAVVGVATALLIGGLGGKPSGGSPIGIAMSLAPPNASGRYTFEFTDVRAVASAVGVRFDQGSAAQQNEAFSTQLNAAGGAWIDDQPSMWHEADVLWQSTAGSSPDTTVHATGLRPSFSFAAIERKFTKCSYKKRKIVGAIVYSGSPSAYARCAGEFGDQAPFQTQIGLLAAEHVVVLASSAEALDAAIRRQGDLHRDPTTSALVKRLAGYPAITVVSGAPYCYELSKAFVGRNPTPAFVREALGANPPGAPYVGFAFGSRFARRRATASLVFYYSDAETARRDLPFREHGLRTETSAQTNQPYADLLRTGTAKAYANSGVLDVAPRTGPLRLWDMWTNSDLAFARC